MSEATGALHRVLVCRWQHPLKIEALKAIVEDLREGRLDEVVDGGSKYEEARPPGCVDNSVQNVLCCRNTEV